MSRPAQRLGADDRDASITECLSLLAQGELLALPTETVYGIGGRVDRPAAVAMLQKLKGKRPFSLHIGSVDDVFLWGRATPQAKRLARAYLPGPLTLVLEATERARPYAAADGTIGIRVVAEPFCAELLRRCEAPLFLSSANQPNQRAATDADAAFEAVGELAAAVVDAGPSALSQASSVVRVHLDGRVDVLREAALERDAILARAATLALFVCSGNTCRSPMAEALARESWASSLGIAAPQLSERGLLVASAGTSAMPGLPASDAAVVAMAEVGLDISGHRSRVLEPALAARASRIWCMSENHRARVLDLLAMVGGPLDDDAREPELLAGEHDILDPYGGPIETYRATRDDIASSIPRDFPR
ncbi:MAG: Sua5/YciO/YrdC/YwlC family protein [Planctomycetes bacterium]|nr:Sua5/YciO/YrdC/YwlC family protein [Planctomycetota bacterium]